MSFCHLHVHSHYSLLDGYARIPDLVRAAKEMGQPAIGLTEHGNMASLVELVEECKKQGVKPLPGVELYLAAGSRFGKDTRESLDRAHLTVLAKNQTGLRNLFRLVSLGHLEGFYYKPRVDRESLEKHGEGLVVLSGCISSTLSQVLLRGDEDQARAIVEWYRERWGGDYYVELQSHPDVEFLTLLDRASALARKLGVRVVATNDVHYVRKEDAAYQQLLSAIGRDRAEEGKRLDDYYLKSSEEMAREFLHLPEALRSTLEIAEKVEQIELPTQVEVPLIPELRGLGPGSAVETLRFRALINLEARYGCPLPPAYQERFAYELEVVRQTGFASYILLVADICRFARSAGIRFGPRGSAAGSLIVHGLGISEPDPIAHGLIFERFLNPARIEMPDVDLDFQDDRRHEIYEYLVQTYGADRVGAVATYGSLGAKAALKDVARAQGIDYSLVDGLTKRMGDDPKLTLAKAEELPAIQEVLADPVLARLWQTARPLEGVARHASTHAAGIVISASPLTDRAPLMRCPKDLDKVQVQYEGDHLQKAGLLKMDILGLDNLTVLDRALKLIEMRRGERIDVWQLPWDDAAAFDLLCRGRVHGVFQLGTGSGRRLTLEVQPGSIADLMALVALDRPGPIDFAPKYVAVKDGRDPFEPPHPAIAEIVSETNGVILYQEQVLQIARKLAGFSYGEADVLRKAIGKKIESLLAEQKEKFVDGTVAHAGLAREEAEGIWAYFEPFANYAFNCLAGDTVVIRGAANCHGPAEITLADLYRVFHSNTVTGNKYRNPKQGVTILSRYSDGRIRPRRVVAVYRRGKRQTFTVTTREGRTIRATADHRFLTTRGWQTVGELVPGDRLVTHAGYEKTRMDGRLTAGNRRGGGYSPYASVHGGGFPHGPVNPGWIDGGHAAFERISRALKSTGLCMLCGGRAALQTHHVDGDRCDNTPENLVVLCDSCHKRADYALGKRRARWTKGHSAGEDVVVDVSPAGEEETYDLEVQGETDDDHNFIANGFVVHNCAHACSYAYLAYQTAYLKAHYPLEFMCALLDVARDSQEKLAAGLAEALALGVEVLPPSIHQSEVGFTIEGEAIRFGLAGVKHVGAGVAREIVANRPYSSLADFVKRGGATRLAAEALIKVGATGFATRAAELAVLPDTIRAVGKVGRIEDTGQLPLFDLDETYPQPDDREEVSLGLRLDWERELCGAWVSERPPILPDCDLVSDLQVGDPARLVGQIRDLRPLLSRSKGEQFVAGELVDATGSVRLVCFPKTYRETADFWVDGALRIVAGRVGEYDGERQLIVDAVEEYVEPLKPDLVLEFGHEDPTPWLDAYATAISRQGDRRVRLVLGDVYRDLTTSAF